MSSRRDEGIRIWCLGSASTGPKSLFWKLLVVRTCWTSAPSSIRPQCWFRPQGAVCEDPKAVCEQAGARQLKLSLSPHVSWTPWTRPTPFPRDPGAVMVKYLQCCWEMKSSSASPSCPIRSPSAPATVPGAWGFYPRSLEDSQTHSRQRTTALRSCI